MYSHNVVDVRESMMGAKMSDSRLEDLLNGACPSGMAAEGHRVHGG